jgi:hypothetical protein
LKQDLFPFEPGQSGVALEPFQQVSEVAGDCGRKMRCSTSHNMDGGAVDRIHGLTCLVVAISGHIRVDRGISGHSRA